MENGENGCGCRKAWKGWGENGKKERKGRKKENEKWREKQKGVDGLLQPLLADTH